MIKFIVLSTQRSGSSYLGVSLDSHPRIRCCEELFMPKNHNEITYRTYRTASLERRVSHLFQRKKLIYSYLEQVLRGSPDVDAFGFKFMYGQYRRFPEVMQWAKESDVRIIHLIRRNTLKMIVSREIARKRGVYFSTKPLQPMKVTLDENRVVKEIQRAARAVEEYRNRVAAFPVLEVFYEEFVANHEYESRRLLEFLNCDADVQLTSNLVKTSKDSLDALIENYSQVHRALEHSPFKCLLS
jgi:LPS sulfotransferase NodH